MRLVLLFPGQGAQYVGMGIELAALCPEAAAVFGHASAVIGEDLLVVCRDGPAELLTRTLYAQPAIVATSLAALLALRGALEARGQPLVPLALAGHSVGELAAVAAAEACDIPTILRLVLDRARAMERTCAQVDGGMSAVLGLNANEVEALCERARLESGEIVEAANFNAPGNVVVGGTRRALAALSSHAGDFGAKRVLPLQVAGAFHTSLMRGAADEFAVSLQSAALRPPSAPLLLNGTGHETLDPIALRSELAVQIAAPVHWARSMERCVALGVQGFVELGPGQALTGLARRIARDVPTYSVQDGASLGATLDALTRIQAD